MSTRYRRRRVYLSYGMEDPVEAIILDSFKDSGSWWFRIKIVEGGYIIDVPVRSVDFLAHRKSAVIRMRPRLKVVKPS